MTSNLANINSKEHCLSRRQVCESLSYVSTKLMRIEGERIVFAGKTPCLTMHLTMGTSYIGIRMKNPRSVMAAVRFDHHVTSSHSKVHCKARGFAYEKINMVDPLE